MALDLLATAHDDDLVWVDGSDSHVGAVHHAKGCRHACISITSPRRGQPQDATRGELDDVVPEHRLRKYAGAKLQGARQISLAEKALHSAALPWSSVKGHAPTCKRCFWRRVITLGCSS